MLNGVRYRFRCDVVHRSLARRVVSSVEADVEVDLNRASPCESGQCVVETGIGEDRWVDAAGELSQLVGHRDEIVRKTRELLRGRLAGGEEAGCPPCPE